MAGSAILAASEGYWGRSELKVRLSTPESIHTAALDLSPRYCEADTLPPASFELMNLGEQLSERTEALGGQLAKLSPAECTAVLEAYLRANLRCFEDDYSIEAAKIFRLPGREHTYVISPSYDDRRQFEKLMYDYEQRSNLRHQTVGTEVVKADEDADNLLLALHLPKDFALHLRLLQGKGVTPDEIRAALKEGTPSNRQKAPNSTSPSIISNYLRYNLARSLINAVQELPPYPYHAYSTKTELKAKVYLSEVTSDEIRAALKEAINSNHPGPPSSDYQSITANYLRDNLAQSRTKKEQELLPYLNSEQTEIKAKAYLTEARELLEVVRSVGRFYGKGNALSTAALHKMADVELKYFLRVCEYRATPRDAKTLLLHLEEGLRLLRLCKEEGDPTAVGSISQIVSVIQRSRHPFTLDELSATPEIRTALAGYMRFSEQTSTSRLSPEYLRSEAKWINSLTASGVRNEIAFVRLAAGLHDRGAKESCLRVLEMCPPGDGIVQLIRAHYAITNKDLAGGLLHLTMAERDLAPKARRHEAILAKHFEYGMQDETAKMYGRVVLEQASLLMLSGDFLAATRQLRRSGMDLFNQEYVMGCLLTITELKQLADEEPTHVKLFWYVYSYPDNEWEDEGGPMDPRYPQGIQFRNHIDGNSYISARVMYARRLLQAGRAQEAVPYWDEESRPDARRYANLIEIATNVTKPSQARGLAYWQAGMLLRSNSNLWACSAGYELEQGEFNPRLPLVIRANSQDPNIVGPAEHARIAAGKSWTSPRNSFFRYAFAEHCLKASELLQGEQSAYVLWYGALALAYIDHDAAEPMRQKLLKDFAHTKIGRQAILCKGLPKEVSAPEMK